MHDHGEHGDEHAHVQHGVHCCFEVSFIMFLKVVVAPAKPESLLQSVFDVALNLSDASHHGVHPLHAVLREHIVIVKFRIYQSEAGEGQTGQRAQTKKWLC